MRERVFILMLLATAVLAAGAQQPERRFVSPDGELTAKLNDTDVRDPRYRESVISVLDSKGNVLSSHDFTSSDGQHGAALVSGIWSPDGQYFVARMEHTGGHEPEFHPIVIWSLRTKRFYELTTYTADEGNSVTAPDRLAVRTWPELKKRIIDLHALKSNERRELK